MARSRVLIVDDHPVTRIGLAELLNAQPDLEACGAAGDVAEAIQQIQRTRPDVAVVDISLRDGSGIELIELVRSSYPDVKILVSSMYDEALFAERALRAGAMGYINKQETTENLLAAIRRVGAGEVCLSPRMANRLLHVVIGGKPASSNPIDGLTNRELEVLELIGQGQTTQQIARKLGLSPKTIETHREKIKSKLNLKNSAELSCRAVQWVIERR